MPVETPQLDPTDDLYVKDLIREDEEEESNPTCYTSPTVTTICDME